MSLYGPARDIRAVVEGNDCQGPILRSRYDGIIPVNKAISNINLFNPIALCMRIVRLFYYLMHFTSLVDHSAMNDGTRKPLNVYDCLMSAKQKNTVVLELRSVGQCM